MTPSEVHHAHYNQQPNNEDKSGIFDEVKEDWRSFPVDGCAVVDAAQQQDGQFISRRERHRERNNLRNRLHSIAYDLDNFLKPLLRTVKGKSETMKSWPLLANQRCGVWYTGRLTTQSCYFKSVDGHVGTWAFSLKRLNLEVVHHCIKAGGCWIVDASRAKQMPDSFSRTIPIWTAVLNRIIARLKEEETWDRTLYTPSIITREEHNTICELLEARVQDVVSSGVLIKPNELLQLSKPLRPFWIVSYPLSPHEIDTLERLSEDFTLIICVSCGFRSDVVHTCTDFTYSTGAADDEEAWSFGLTPTLFWNNQKNLLKVKKNNDLEIMVQKLLEQTAELEPEESHDLMYHEVGSTGLSIGSRRAGKPLECWKQFDAMLNVSMLEYDGLDQPMDGKFYLQLPVEEGKRDKTELERWMAVGIVFLTYHLASGRRVLVHCAQGRDRSVAIAIATLVLFLDKNSDTPSCRQELNMVQDFVANSVTWSNDDGRNSLGDDGFYKASGLPGPCVQGLLGRRGRDRLLEWCQERFGGSDDRLMATKASLRVVLQNIKLYRPEVSPSRSTMQKLNRFFMSDCTQYDKDHGDR